MLRSLVLCAVGIIFLGPTLTPPPAVAKVPTEAMWTELLALDHELHDVINGANAMGQSGIDQDRLDRLKERIQSFTASCGPDCPEDLVAKRHQLQSAVSDLKSGFTPWTLPKFPANKAATSCTAAPSVKLGTTFHGREGQVTWVRFTVNTTGRYRVTTLGSRGDSSLAVYAGCSGEVLADVDDSIGLAASATVNASKDEILYVAMQGVGGDPIGQIVAEATLGEASLAGTVTEMDGTPIPNILVRLYDLSSFNSFSRATDANGEYVFSGVSASTYVVATRNFSDIPYLDIAWPDVICQDPCFPVNVGTPIVVETTSQITDIDLELPRGGEIAGRIRDSGSVAPLTNASVTAYQSDGQSIAFDFVDSVGRYRFRRLEPGTFYVSASAQEFRSEVWRDQPCPDGGQCNPLAGEPIEIGLGEIRSEINLDLDRLGSIRVDLEDSETGEPIFFGSFTVYDTDGNFVGSSSSLSLNGLPGGAYFMTADASGYQPELYEDLPCPSFCDVTHGTPLAVVDGETTVVSVSLDPNGSISGTVVDADTQDPIFAWLSVFDEAGNFVTSNSPLIEGSYEFNNLGPGQYRVYATIDSYQGEVWEETPCSANCNVTGDLVTLAIGQDVQGIDFTLSRLGSIAGRVTDAETADGIPFPSVRVFDAAGQSFSFALEQSDGTYMVDSLPAGTYFVTADDGPDYLAEVWENIDCESPCDPLTGTPIVLGLGEERMDIDFALAQAPAIRGTIRETGSGELILDARIRIYDEQGGFVASSFSFDGNFNIAGLAEGTYYVEVSGDNEHVTVLWEDVLCFQGTPFGCSPLDGTPVVVGSEGVTLEVFLPVGAALSGTVTSTGAPTPFGTVRIFNASGTFVFNGFLNELGQWQVEGLAAGTYYAIVDPSLHTNQLWAGLPCGVAGTPTCDPTQGTTITIALGETRTDIDFVVERLGQIEGTVTGVPGTVDFGRIVLYDSMGQVVDSQSNGIDTPSGNFRFDRLVPGTYYLGTEIYDRYHDRIFGGEFCEPGPCDPTSGTSLEVTLAAIVGPLDFSLNPGPGVRVEIRSSPLEAPIAGVAVDVWTVNQELVESRSTDANGTVLFGVEPGTYLFSTDAGTRYVDELWQDVSCPDGPAFLGLCDLAPATPVDLLDPAATQQLTFVLEAIGLIFANGFESGDTDAWSNTQP